MFQNPGVPKESPRVRHGVCPIFPALCVMVWQCLIIFSKKCLSPLDNFGKRCYPLRIRKAALPYSGFRMLLPTKGRPFRQRMPFCSVFCSSAHQKLTFRGISVSITIRIQPRFTHPGVHALLPAVEVPRIPAEPPLRVSFSPAAASRRRPVSLGHKNGGQWGFGFFRPSGIRQKSFRHPAASRPPFSAPQRTFRPVFAICARLSCKTALTNFRQPLDKSPRECYDKNVLRSYIENS